jgi:cystathionine beta-lyase
VARAVRPAVDTDVVIATSTFDAVELEAVRRRTSEKWRRYPPDVLPAHIAEMDFPLAPPVARALQEAVGAGDVGYAVAARSELPQAFAAFAERRWRWQVDPDGVVAVPDVMVGVAELLRLLTAPGDGVVVTTPVYPPFFSVIREVGRTVVEAPLLEPEAERRVPLDGIRGALARGARAMLLCNPHNPTGYVAKEDELVALAEIVREHDAVLLSDEVHAPLALEDAAHVPFGSLPSRAADAAVVLTAATKGWNFAGLKCALAVAVSDRMRQALAALPVDLHDRVGHLGVVASTAAFTEGEPWLDDLRDYLAETHAWLPQLLAERVPGIRCHRAEASFLAWLDCRGLGIGDDPATTFFERGRVALVPGPTFGEPGRGFARLNVGTSRAVVGEAVRRIATAVA